jgi:phage-related protein
MLTIDRNIAILITGGKMAEIDVVIYAEENRADLLEWLDEIPEKAQDKCIIKIERLGQLGHELRRPEGDFLRDGIYELRASLKRVQYRILYFFHSKIGVLSHGFIKTGNKVPAKEIDRAIENKTKFSGNPEKHTYREELS